MKNFRILPLIFSLVLSGPVLAQEIADVQDRLPDIGTTAGDTLSISQENILGDYYSRQLRGGAPLIYDPLLNSYINSLGQKLVANASSVRMPFHFYLLNNDEINAFAFFGGNVVIHSGLLWETKTESQLASVIAHEIAHVTQRHLARAMEAQRKNNPLTWAGAFGSMLLAMANPAAGMAALTTTMAGTEQSVISFTQSNEKEADRIGIKTLTNAGFNPQAMPDFLQRLSEKYSYSSTPPEMLLTHPLPESRISDTRIRAQQMPKKNPPSSLDYLLSKMRIEIMFDSSSTKKQRLQILFEQYAKGNNNERIAANYGQALLFFHQQKFNEARQSIQSLLKSQPNNPWFLDLITDIDLKQQNYAQAISRLEEALTKTPKSTILQINLANAYVESKQMDKAISLLNRYTFNNPDDLNGWSLLEEAQARSNNRSGELAARAEVMALTDRIEEAVSLLSNASDLAKKGSMEKARYSARKQQLKTLDERFKKL